MACWQRISSIYKYSTCFYALQAFNRHLTILLSDLRKTVVVIATWALDYIYDTMTILSLSIFVMIFKFFIIAFMFH